MLPAACLRTWANVDEWEAARGGQWMRGGRGVKPWHVGGGRACESLEDAEEGWAWNWQGNFKRKAVHAFTLWKPVADAMCMSVKSILRFYIDYCLLWPPPRILTVTTGQTGEVLTNGCAGDDQNAPKRRAALGIRDVMEITGDKKAGAHVTRAALDGGVTYI